MMAIQLTAWQSWVLHGRRPGLLRAGLSPEQADMFIDAVGADHSLHALKFAAKMVIFCGWEHALEKVREILAEDSTAVKAGYLIALGFDPDDIKLYIHDRVLEVYLVGARRVLYSEYPDLNEIVELEAAHLRKFL